MLDLQAGRIMLMATSIGSSVGMIKQGKIRAVATTGLKRAAALPDVPTAAEQGLTGYDVVSWPGGGLAPREAQRNRDGATSGSATTWKSCAATSKPFSRASARQFRNRVNGRDWYTTPCA